MKQFIISALILSVLFASCGKLKEESKTVELPQKTEDVKEKQTSDVQETESNKADNNALSEVTGIKYDIGKPHNSVKYEGRIVASVSWNDKNGENIVIISETNEREKGKSPFGDRYLEKEIYGYQYTEKGGGYEQIWKIQDFIRECDFDLTLKYIRNSLTITDINKNGIAESTFLYRMSCKSDVSPDGMKLMMHEGKDKYAIRGTMVLRIQGEGPYGGEMKTDASFNNAPEGFLDYAKKQWNKYKNEEL